mgnify:CR=1 FL=1
MALPTQHSASPWDEVYRFLAESPSADEVLTFKPSQDTQARLDLLLDKGNAGTITSDERRELDEFLQIEHFFSMLKIAIRRRLSEDT